MITLKNKREENKVCKQVIGFDPIKCECKTITMCNLQSGGKTLFSLQKLMDSLTIKGWECVRSLRNYVDVDSIAV